MSRSAQGSRPSFFKKAVCIAALTGGWGAVASDSLPASMGVSALAATGTASESRARANSGEALSALRIFNRVMLLMKDNYVDPKRINPRKMLLSALDGVERQVAEVMVEGDEKSPEVRITIGAEAKSFDISRVDNLWNMSFALRSMFAFIAQNVSYDGKSDARDIEYAAVNGMLSTLDPHSVMLKSEYFKEMSLQSKGEFGGLGFVLQMKEGELTILRVMKDTPAFRAGLRSKDVIVRINGETMVNADLNEAVNRLRGKPGTSVRITVRRASWKAPRELTIERAIIKFDSVQAKLLEGGIGYIRLKGFQANTAQDIVSELKAMRGKAGKEGLKGLVLDLRGNPGGLLDQAVAISDMFLKKGDIVTTVGYSDKLRDSKRARPGNPEEELPLVVLVNPSSASASEIVAGALKNNDRAMVIGRQSFGKGSVQVLYDRFPDDGALKLTIAQYLTPGGKSIQEVGITPDIELIPGRIGEERIDFFAPERQMSEADLEQHFGNPDAETVATKHEEVVRTEKPLETFLYLREAPRPKPKDGPKKPVKSQPSKPGASGSEQASDEDLDVSDMAEFEGIDPNTDEIVEDFPIRFARELLQAAPVLSRTEMLEKTKALRVQLQERESKRVEEAIGRLGVDWGTESTLSSPSVTPQDVQSAGAPLEAVLTPEGQVKAGETVSWKLSVTNKSSQTFTRLRAYSDSANGWFDRREFIFGRLAPGETREWTNKVKLPRELPSRREPVTMHFMADGSDSLFDYKSETDLVELEKPAFAFAWRVEDACPKCNGDGALQIGEKIGFEVDVKNIGAGKAFETVASIRNKDFEEGLSLIKGRVRLGAVEPGETKRAHFELELSEAFDKPEAVIQIVLSDEETGEWVVETARLPLTEGRVPGAARRAAVKVQADAPIYAAADADAPILGTLAGGTTLVSEGTVGDFHRVRVRFGGGQASDAGFVRAQDVAAVSMPAQQLAKMKAPAVDLSMMRQEPKITFEGVDFRQGGLVTTDDSVTLKGTVSNETGLRDVYWFVNNQKVFFRAAPKDGTTIAFDAKLPLKEGKNVAYVVARENRNVQTYKMVIVTRLPADGAAGDKAKPAK